MIINFYGGCYGRRIFCLDRAAVDNNKVGSIRDPDCPRTADILCSRCKASQNLFHKGRKYSQNVMNEANIMFENKCIFCKVTESRCDE